MNEQALQRFDRKVQQALRHKQKRTQQPLWKLIERTDDPPRATLRRSWTPPTQRPTQHYQLTIWIDDDGNVQEKQTMIQPKRPPTEADA